MNGIVLCLNEVETMKNGPAVACPNCLSASVRRWGTGRRNVFDTKPINAVVLRYYCTDCGRTFRFYPQGVDRSQLSVRIRRLAALLWLMDLSTRDVEEIFESLGVSINRMTVWREGQKLIDELTQLKLLSPDRRFSIHRLNPGQPALEGIPFAICLDMTTIAILGKIFAASQDMVVKWLHAVVAEQEIEILNLKDFDYSTAELLYLPQ